MLHTDCSYKKKALSYFPQSARQRAQSLWKKKKELSLGPKIIPVAEQGKQLSLVIFLKNIVLYGLMEAA